MIHAIWTLLVALQITLPVQPKPIQPIAFTGVTIIDATGASPQLGMTLIIEGNRIAALGKSDQVTAPANARTVKADGKFLIPGLWDMHVHWYDEPSLPLFLTHGVTGVRVMCGYPVHLRWRKAVDSGQLLGPRFNLAGPIVDGPEPVWLDSLRARQRGTRPRRGAHHTRSRLRLREGLQFPAARRIRWRGRGSP